MLSQAAVRLALKQYRCVCFQFTW